jgi:hypothetical protein
MKNQRGLVGGWVCGLALLGAWVGCSPRTDIGVSPSGGSGGERHPSPQAGSGGGPAEAEGGSPGGGSAGSQETPAGTGAGGSGDTGGTTSAGTSAGGSGDTGGTTSAGTGAGGGSGMSGSAGAGGSPPDLTIVKRTAGCGTTAPADLIAQQFVERTMQTSGHKDSSTAPASCRPGGQTSYDWSFTRTYSVRLPSGYDPEKAYPLVIQATQCGDDHVYPLVGIAEQVITVSVSASADYCPATPFRCYDVLERDHSIELPFYEGIWERLSSELCFDQNRVFATGWITDGSIWANVIGCVYAGHAKYPIRAIGASMGGLPGYAQPTPNRPLCSQSPMAGIWIDNADQLGPIDLSNEGIITARKGCSGGSNQQPYPVPGVDAGSGCYSYVDCPPYPVVRCSYGSFFGPKYDIPTMVDPTLSYFFSTFFAP